MLSKTHHPEPTSQDGQQKRFLSQGLPCPAGPDVFFAPDWIVRGHNLAHETRCSGVGKRLISAPISARMICAVAGPMPGTASSFSARTRAVTTFTGRIADGAVVWGGDLLQGADDEPVEFLDLRGEMVDGAQQHPQQPGVMVLELASEGLDEGGLLLDQVALGEIGEGAWVAFASDHRVEHGPSGHAEQVRDEAGQFDLRILKGKVNGRLL